MLFAKALCAAFVLSLTNFGESQRLNNYNYNSTVKSVLPRTMKKPVTDIQGRLYAEQCSRSLLTMLSNWGAQGPFVVASWENQESLNFDEMNKNLDQFKNLPGGLYFIFCRAESSRFVYPVYVGMTSQSFYARLSQQKYQVLSDISSDKWEINFCKKFVVYVKFVSTPTAKFLESIFLAAFNFARNIMENIGTRNIDKNAIETPVDGIKHFKDILMDEIARLNNAIN